MRLDHLLSKEHMRPARFLGEPGGVAPLSRPRVPGVVAHGWKHHRPFPVILVPVWCWSSVAGPGGQHTRSGVWGGGGVGALLGPEGTGPAFCPRVGVGGRWCFLWWFPDSFWPVCTGRLPCGPRCGVGVGGVGGGVWEGRGWVFVNWIVDASI